MEDHEEDRLIHTQHSLQLVLTQSVTGEVNKGHESLNQWHVEGGLRVLRSVRCIQGVENLLKARENNIVQLCGVLLEEAGERVKCV